MLEFIYKTESSWERIKRSGLPVVIYGMGNGADKVIDEFIRLDIPIKGVTASDDFVRGQIFRGFKVKKLSEFDGEFIIAVAFATCIPEVMNRIYGLCDKYDVIVPCVPVYGDEIFNRDFIEKHKEEIIAVYNLFDDYSKKIYAGCIKFIFSGDLKILRDITEEKNEVFENILCFNNNESYLDLGAYRGDTVDEFLNYCNRKYKSIVAVEPDKRTFKKLCDYLADIPNSKAVNCAIYSKCDSLLFSDKAGRQSSLSDIGKLIKTVTIDEICKNIDVTYIKMDVEGAESNALDGGLETLKYKKPKLNIALYHRSEDIFKLPLMISRINPDYKFHIRRHPYIPCWDMNLYCT